MHINVGSFALFVHKTAKISFQFVKFRALFAMIHSKWGICRQVDHFHISEKMQETSMEDCHVIFYDNRRPWAVDSLVLCIEHVNVYTNGILISRLHSPWMTTHSPIRCMIMWQPDNQWSALQLPRCILHISLYVWHKMSKTTEAIYIVSPTSISQQRWLVDLGSRAD